MKAIGKWLGLNYYESQDNPLFLAKDIAEILEHSCVPVMVANLDDDEKVKKQFPINGRNKKTWFVTENGFVELLMISRKEIAKKFRKELFEMVKKENLLIKR